MDDPPQTDAREPLPKVRWRSRVVLPIALAPVLAAVLWPFDRAIYDALTGIKARGDVARELLTLGQFGALGSMVVAGALVYLLDRPRFRRLLDWVFAAAVGSLLFKGMKVLVGRGRPVLGDPDLVLGPTGVHTTPAGETMTALAGASELGAMPSLHTTHAVIAAVCLGVMYPRLRGFLYAWAALVGVLRVYHTAHWPTDVVVGALLAYPLAYVIATRSWGVRGLDWFWCTVIDRKATPAFPELIARERTLRA
ncbi:MAG: phosphatase PAP2 family protein [Planctomycetota bacterium]